MVQAHTTQSRASGPTMKSGTVLVMRAVEEVCVSFSFPEEEEDGAAEEEDELTLVSLPSVLVSRSIGFSANNISIYQEY